MTQLKTEKCIFKAKQNSVILAIYIDDGILLGKDQTEMRKLLAELKQDFEITIEENPSIFLGIKFEKTEGTIRLTQEDYAKQVLETYSMQDSKPTDTPLALDKGYQENESHKVIAFPFREAVGSLLYISNKTRPDLAFAVNFCSRYTTNPGNKDIQNVKRILRYLQGTIQLGIKYKEKECQKLIAYCDSDYAGDLDTRKSTTGYVIYYKGGLVGAPGSNKLWPLDYRSRIHSSIRVLQRTLVPKSDNRRTCREDSRKMHVDNQSAIKIIKNGTFNKRSKHIDVRYHFIHEKVEENSIKINYVKSDAQVADILTKPLGKHKFDLHREKLVG